MTNTSKIDYTKRPKAPAPGGSVPLQAGQDIWLTGPLAGQVATERVPSINYRKAGR